MLPKSDFTLIVLLGDRFLMDESVAGTFCSVFVAVLSFLLPAPVALRSRYLFMIPDSESGAGIGPGLGLGDLRRLATISLHDLV